MFQEFEIVGNLGGDPVMKYSQTGIPFTNMSVAVNQTNKDESGNQVKQTMWVRVTVWRANAENCDKYLKKGSKVLIKGTLQFDAKTGGPRLWTDREGGTRASFEMNGNTVRFLSSQENGNGNGGSHATEAAEETTPAADGSALFN